MGWTVRVTSEVVELDGRKVTLAVEAWDDLAENVEAARAIGLHAIRFTSTAAALDGVRRLLR